MEGTGCTQEQELGAGGCWCPEDGAERAQEAPPEGLVVKWPSEPQGEPAIVGRRV